MTLDEKAKMNDLVIVYNPLHEYDITTVSLRKLIRKEELAKRDFALYEIFQFEDFLKDLGFAVVQEDKDWYFTKTSDDECLMFEHTFSMCGAYLAIRICVWVNYDDEDQADEDDE